MSLLDGFIQESGLAVFERYVITYSISKHFILSFKCWISMEGVFYLCFIDYITFTGGGVDPPYFAA